MEYERVGVGAYSLIKIWAGGLTYYGMRKIFSDLTQTKYSFCSLAAVASIFLIPESLIIWTGFADEDYVQ